MFVRFNGGGQVVGYTPEYLGEICDDMEYVEIVPEDFYENGLCYVRKNGVWVFHEQLKAAFDEANQLSTDN